MLHGAIVVERGRSIGTRVRFGSNLSRGNVVHRARGAAWSCAVLYTMGMIQAHDVVQIVMWFAAAGIPVWLDGGWGIDALVGAQTRPHDDLDVIIALAYAQRAQTILQQHGFMLHEDERPTRFVLRDPTDRRIDVHTVVFDAQGGGVQHLQNGTSFRYPPEGFHGVGQIAGQPLRCLTPDVQLRCHVGYPPDATDHHDMQLLHTHFGLALPPPYTP